jgi:putative ABC transport system permease protein
VLVFATDAEALFDIYPEWRTAPDQLRALAVTRTGAIVGDVLMKAYGWKVGDRLPLTTSMVKQDGSSEWDLEIVGTYDVKGSPSQANRVIINYAYFDEARQFDKGRVFGFIVSIDDPARSAQMCAAIDALFSISSDETLTQDESAYASPSCVRSGDVSAMGTRSSAPCSSRCCS